MLESDKVFAGSIPENYDRYILPLIFERFAADLAQRAASLSPSAVLEIAAGTGVVTRALAPKLSPDARYVVTDLNPTMLDYAASRQAPNRGHRRIFPKSYAKPHRGILSANSAAAGSSVGAVLSAKRSRH